MFHEEVEDPVDVSHRDSADERFPWPPEGPADPSTVAAAVRATSVKHWCRASWPGSMSAAALEDASEEFRPAAAALFALFERVAICPPKK